MYKYAQINQDGVAEGISQLYGEIIFPHMILLDGSHENDNEVTLLWRYIGGKWFPPEIEENNK